tara:strand:+ start:229 stop:1230 length:1002 start_codon:yes stop_codon:yes gene_type:complete
MNYYNYNNVRLSVNGQELLADSASFSVNASSDHSAKVGQAGNFEYLPNAGLKTSASLSFFVTGQDPFYASTKQNESNIYSIDAAGLSLQTGYLNSYRFSASPHGPAKISIGLDFYEDFGGTFTPTTVQDEERDYLKFSDMDVTIQGIDASSKLISLSYDYSVAMEPVYRVGEVVPYRISYKEKSSSLSLETYNILETLPYQGKEVIANMTLGGMAYEVKGVLESKSLDFSVGTKLKSSLKIKSNKYGDLPTITSFAPSPVNGGAQLTIYGTNLANVTSVVFNNGIASNKIHNISETQFDVVVPRFARTGPCKVITPAGEASSSVTINNPIFIP